MDRQAFYDGKAFDAHEYLGAHVLPDGTGVVFRAFAPAASSVEVLLYRTPDAPAETVAMRRGIDGNFFEATVADAHPGMLYELRIHHAPDETGATTTDHCDPYGFAMELRPAHRSIICDIDAAAAARDEGDWPCTRAAALRHDRPLNIYELHLGSWRRPEDDPDRWYTYRELAQPLVEHLQRIGANAVEFMPVLEHPADESWGYQDTGFFAATSRYGTPADLMALIDTLHRAHIAVILDFVPVHFACDAYGLARFDGTALYEYPHDAVGVSEWGSMNFMHSRGEVRSFLMSSAAFWMGVYGFDGLRLDAVSRLIYWQGDERRGVNGNTVGFLRTMNEGLKARFPERLLIAEDSTTYPGTTRAVDAGGLGFDYKWDLGWMHDTLSFFQMPPAERRANYHKLTFSMMYYYNERHLLALSHDENVHGKATIAQKMNGAYEGKFPQLRCLYAYMAAHPGKKLLFMGSEIAQLREWDERREQDWDLVRYPIHDAHLRFMSELGHLYEEHPALWERDFARDGFTWLDCHEEERLLYAFLRTGARVPVDGGAPAPDARKTATDGQDAVASSEAEAPALERVAFIMNADDAPHDFTVELAGTDAEGAASCQVLIDSDWQRFGGTTPDGQTRCTIDEDGALAVHLPPFSAQLVALDPAEQA